MSKRLLRHLIDHDGVKVNGRSTYLTSRVLVGQSIEIILPQETSAIAPESIKLDIRYEDDEVLVVNKPSSVLTHPTAHERSGSLLAGVASYLQPLGQVPHCIHRLDRDTSGVVMFAKHAHTHHVFDVALRAGKVHRAYVALVYCSKMPELQANDSGFFTLNLPIAGDPNHPSRRMISPDGQVAITHFRIWDWVGKVAIVQLILETGRTHQIRLHMASVGLPLLGDRDYTMAFSAQPIPKDADSYRKMMARQALHAYNLTWTHPVTDETVHVSAPIADDMVELWTELGGSAKAWGEILKSIH